MDVTVANTNLTCLKDCTVYLTLYLFYKICIRVLSGWKNVLARKSMLLPTERCKIAQYDRGIKYIRVTITKYQFNLAKVLQLS